MTPRGRALLWAALPLLILTPPLLWLGDRFESQLSYELRTRTEQTLQLYAGDVQRSLDRIEGKLESLEIFVAGQTDGGQALDDARFNTFAAGLHASAEWIRAFQVVSDGVITHCYPRAGNETVVGFNLLADPRPVIGGDVIRAWQTGRVTVTGPIDLIQGGLGIIIRKPIVSNAAGPARLVAVVLNIAPLLAESGLNVEGAEAEGTGAVQIAIRREVGEVFFGPPAVFTQQPAMHRLSLPEGAWEMGACPRAGGWAPLGHAVLLFHLAGALIAFLVALLVFSLAHREETLAQTVRERTDALRGELVARQRAQEELRRNYNLLQAVTEGTSDGVFVRDRQGNYQMINSAGARFLGRVQEAIIGQSDREWFSAETVQGIMDGDRQVIESGKVQTLEERGTTAGVTRIYQTTKAPWRDEHGGIIGVIGVSRDVTEDKRAEAALQESENRYRFLFEHNPMPMLIYERGTLQMLAVNESFLRHYGYSTEEALALHLTDLYPDEDKPRIAELAARLHGHANAGEWRHRRRDGSFITIVAHSHDLEYQGRSARVAVMTDITERKRAEEEVQAAREGLEQRVRQRTAELAVAKERAESADRLKSAFLATMSHELRTPLNSIIGFTGIMLQGLAGPLNGEQTKQLGMVQSSARHLLALINDVLDISKIEAGQLELRLAPFDLPALVEKVTAIVRPLAEKKGLSLRVELPAAAGEVVGDALRIEQVVLNLLNNAIKFTEHGEVALAAEVLPDWRAPRSEAPQPAICLRVSDTGIGIQAEDLDKVFQPFRQIDTGLARLREGTGLGLTICRRLADLMGGEISVRSEWSQGSTFTFTFPTRCKGTS
jgi:PAS domain S-box-containing protein